MHAKTFIFLVVVSNSLVSTSCPPSSQRQAGPWWVPLPQGITTFPGNILFNCRKEREAADGTNCSKCLRIGQVARGMGQGVSRVRHGPLESTRSRQSRPCRWPHHD